MTQNLTEFFRDKKQRSDAEAANIDWDRLREEWLAAITFLYGQIANWLTEPIRLGSVRLVTQSREVTEDHLGTYAVDDLLLIVGDERVTFAPKGRNVIGAEGRVDVSGDSGKAMFVVHHGPRWSVVTSRAPQLKLEPLDEASFAETIQAVMRQ